MNNVRLLARSKHDDDDADDDGGGGGDDDARLTLTCCCSASAMDSSIPKCMLCGADAPGSSYLLACDKCRVP